MILHKNVTWKHLFYLAFSPEMNCTRYSKGQKKGTKMSSTALLFLDFQIVTHQQFQVCRTNGIAQDNETWYNSFMHHTIIFKSDALAAYLLLQENMNSEKISRQLWNKNIITEYSLELDFPLSHWPKLDYNMTLMKKSMHQMSHIE